MTPSPNTPRRSRSPWRTFGIAVSAVQRDIAAALDLTPESRADTVVAMLKSNARRAPGYWIQLTLSMGIATLGLVLGSTAVVIGAMLVSPLMGPIIELGMGFAVGSSLLVLRSFIRVFLSVVWVIVGAAVITVLLPFHEVTSEIASRTAPTALDLILAAFCALTAAYTTVRVAADTTAAAAGTAIGIALVPPLCVTGYGVGTGSAAIASGAGLLFTANFSAIVVLAALSFVLLGYNAVDADPLESIVLSDDHSASERLAERAQRRLRGLFGSRYGRIMRVLIPAVFLLSVYVPLGRALDEVAWQVRVRNAVDRLLTAEGGRIVQTSLTAERHAVRLRLVALGTPEAADALERHLIARVAAVAGVAPDVSVTAVPDAAALEALTADRRSASPDVVQAQPDVPMLRQRVSAAVGVEWPTAEAGPVVGWTFEMRRTGDPVVRVQHLGPPVGAAATAMLAGRVTGMVGSRVDVIAEPLRTDTLTSAGLEDAAWIARAIARSTEAARAPSAVVCVTTPDPPAAARARTAYTRIAEAISESPAARNGQLVRVPGNSWTLWLAGGDRARSCGQAEVVLRSPTSL